MVHAPLALRAPTAFLLQVIYGRLRALLRELLVALALGEELRDFGVGVVEVAEYESPRAPMFCQWIVPASVGRLSRP